MVRVIVAAIACVALGTLLVADGRSLSTREILLRESETLLPPEARVLERDYHERCLELITRRSPPCLSVRFVLSGPADNRPRAILARAGDRWRVARMERHHDGWDLRFFRPGPFRAQISIRSPESRASCRSYSPPLSPLSCSDYLRVELGPPAVIPKLFIDPNVMHTPLTDEELDLLRRITPHVLKKK